MATDTVLLVDKNDTIIGTEEKLKAHQEGKLHRCFSIFVFNAQGELLLQRRAIGKYHSEGLWSNTCCSHQKPGEEENITVHQRLKEEMGFDCELKKAFVFSYKKTFANGLTEHEIDHVFIGTWNGTPKPDPAEVMDWKWIMLVLKAKVLSVRVQNFLYDRLKCRTSRTLKVTVLNERHCCFGISLYLFFNFNTNIIILASAI